MPFPGARPGEPGGRGRGTGARDGAPARGDAPLETSGREGDARRGGRRFRPDGAPPAGQPVDPAALTPPGVPPAGNPDPNLDPTHLKIDLAPIRRELFREMAPTGTFEKMTPEERQRVGREVNQRLLGIVQGLQLSAAEIQKKAEAAKQQAAAERAAAGKPSGTTSLPPPVAPATPSATAPTPPSTPSRTTVATPAPPPAVASVPGPPRGCRTCHLRQGHGRQGTSSRQRPPRRRPRDR